MHGMRLFNHGRFDGVDLRQVACDAAPLPGVIAIHPYFTGGVTHIHTDRVEAIGVHGLTFDCPPRLAYVQAIVEKLPGGVARNIRRGLAIL